MADWAKAARRTGDVEASSQLLSDTLVYVSRHWLHELLVQYSEALKVLLSALKRAHVALPGGPAAREAPMNADGRAP